MRPSGACPDPACQAPACDKAAEARILSIEEWRQALVEAALARKGDSPLVVTFSDHRYSPILMNWLAALEDIGISNVLVISLDDVTHQLMRRAEVSSFRLPDEACDRDRFWVLRMRVFRDLCEGGVTFVHSDTDAIWLQNPFVTDLDLLGHDLIASQGTIWPLDVAGSQGFVLCCGFFMLRSSSASRALMEAAMHIVEECEDDQIALNRALVQKGIQWSTALSTQYKMELNGHLFSCFESVIEGFASQIELGVALLPQHRFQRIHSPLDSAVVCHPLTPKDAEEKRAVLNALGCWFIDHPART